MVQHYRSLEDLSLKNCWLTIGVFDGVHLGHQELLSKLTAGAHAAGAPAVVLTFYPHPAEVLGKHNNLKVLTLPDEKAALLGALGVDVVVTHPFNKGVASLSAWEFMSRLKVYLNMQQLWVGYDFALGRDRRGDIVRLAEIGRELGYELHTVSPVKAKDDPGGKLRAEVISSRQIRAWLTAGEVAEAEAQLGRCYAVSGVVVHGDGRGKKINIPTANINVPAEKVIPANGVYACWAWVGERRHPGVPKVQGHPAVTNVGIRPTFTPDMQNPSVETHILDFERDLYDQEVRLEFVERLRGEQKFPSVEALIEMIQRDIGRAREILV